MQARFKDVSLCFLVTEYLRSYAMAGVCESPYMKRLFRGRRGSLRQPNNGLDHSTAQKEVGSSVEEPSLLATRHLPRDTTWEAIGVNVIFWFGRIFDLL